MAKIVKKIGTHSLEAEHSSWTGVAKIRLDGEELLSKFVLRGHTETVSVEGRVFLVKFGGTFFPDIKIEEVASEVGQIVPPGVGEQPAREMKAREEMKPWEALLARGIITPEQFEAKRREVLGEAVGIFCYSCGASNLPTWKFCSSCGAPLPAP